MFDLCVGSVGESTQSAEQEHPRGIPCVETEAQINFLRYVRFEVDGMTGLYWRNSVVTECAAW